jgi:hypothetical protein
MTDEKQIMTLMSNEELTLAETQLVNKLGFDKSFVTVNEELKNVEYSMQYLVSLGRAIELEIDEWLSSSSTKAVYLRTVLLHANTQQTFLEATLKLEMATRQNSAKIVVEGDSTSKLSEVYVNKTYYVRRVPSFNIASLNDDELLDSEGNGGTFNAFPTLKQDCSDMQEVSQKTFWNVIKYLIYSGTVQEYRILCEAV